jgi:tellurite resistance protein
MSESRDYLEIAFRSIECFSDDGKLRVDELQKLVDVALRDGVVDANEKRVLRNIMRRLKTDELTPEMLARIEAVRAATGI